MSKTDKIKKIIKDYEEKVVTLQCDEARISLYNELIEQATNEKLEVLKTCFEGYKAHIKGQNEIALQYFNETIKQYPNFTYAIIGLGNIYFKKEEYDNAIKNYKKAIELDDRDLTSRYNLGQVYLKKEDFQEAINYFNQVIELDISSSSPMDDPDFKYYLGLALMENGDYHEAIEALSALKRNL